MDRRIVTRLAIMQLMVVSVSFVLLGRLWQLQLGSSTQETTDATVQKTVSLPAVRGRILDSHGRVLVGNVGRLVIAVDRSVSSRLDEHTRTMVFRRLGRLLGTSPDNLRGKAIPCGEPGAVSAPGCWSGSSYGTVPLASKVEPALALTVAERADEFPGIVVEPHSLRDPRRPRGAETTHVLGYLAPPTATELSRPGVEPTDLVGRTGLEQTYDNDLRGVHGSRTLEIDVAGRVNGVGSERAPRPGHDLITSLDARIQAIAERELGKAIRKARRTIDPITGRPYVAAGGAVVVLDARSGRVHAMASSPSYDPDIWRDGLSSPERAILVDPKAPMISRALQGEYAPGSTFKAVSTAAGFERGLRFGTVLPCPDSMQIGGQTFRNYRSRSYGPLRFDRALAVSCDTFFYQLAIDLWRKEGPRRSSIASMAESFGLGNRTGIDLPGEADGHVGRRFPYAGDAALLSIGQGETTVTPLQLAVAYGAIANGGTVWRPRIGQEIVDARGRHVRSIRPEVTGRLPVGERKLEAIRAALRKTTTEGTAAVPFHGFPLDTVSIAAKTGTAEVAGKQPTSWLATFDDRYVVVMMVDQGGTGSGTSGEAVRAIWEALIE